MTAYSTVAVNLRFFSRDILILKDYVRSNDIRGYNNKPLTTVQTIYSIIHSFVREKGGKQ